MSPERPAADAPVRIVLATPLPPELRSIITDVDPRVELIVDDDLLPPQRHPGDHTGDPAFRRTADQQRRFEQLLTRGEILYGIPGVDAAQLAHAVRANPGLRWVQTMAAGGGATVREADLTRDELDRVVFTTSAGVHGPTLTEFAVLGLLAGAKDLPRLQAQQRSHQWSSRWAMRQLHEMTVLIIGLGGIGAETARVLAAFGTRVIGMRRNPAPVPHVEQVVGPDDLPTALAEADGIVITLPGTPDTDGLYGAAMIAATRPGAIVVNVGRGTVIDEAALIDGLDSGRLAYAALDVTATEPLPADSPLWDRDDVLLSPHTAALSALEDRRIVELFADNLRRRLDGRPLRNVVDTRLFY